MEDAFRATRDVDRKNVARRILRPRVNASIHVGDEWNGNRGKVDVQLLD